MSLVRRLYDGETAFPLIRRRKVFYAISGVLVLVALLSMVFRGFNLGVDFKGGTTFQFPANGHSLSDARATFDRLGEPDTTNPVELGRPGTSAKDIRVQTATLSDAETDRVISAISKDFGIRADQVNPSSVGAAWGKQVTDKALQGLGLFLVAVIIYISIRFEPKMAVASIIALIHDLILAAGIYSIIGFVVTPSTIIALLTVLGYSLYDTIVVFDRVEENTRGLLGGSRSTYSTAAELAVNQTFMRSINTSLIALLPVSGLLFVGAILLGAGTLEELSLALFVGLASGAYSSLFLATPLLADLKEREPQYQALAKRVAAKDASPRRPRGGQRETVGAGVAAAGAGGSVAIAGPGVDASGGETQDAAAVGAQADDGARAAARKRVATAPPKRKGTRPTPKRKR